MLEQLKRQWERFREFPAGERFECHYERRQEHRGTPFKRALFIGGGLLIMAAGVFFLPAPGPGMLILLIGASLVAQESRVAARVLDWTELRLRTIASWAESRWHDASPAIKVLLAVSVLVVLGAVAYGAYVVFFAA